MTSIPSHTLLGSKSPPRRDRLHPPPHPHRRGHPWQSSRVTLSHPHRWSRRCGLTSLFLPLFTYIFKFCLLIDLLLSSFHHHPFPRHRNQRTRIPSLSHTSTTSGTFQTPLSPPLKPKRSSCPTITTIILVSSTVFLSPSNLLPKTLTPPTLPPCPTATLTP